MRCSVSGALYWLLVQQPNSNHLPVLIKQAKDTVKNSTMFILCVISVAEKLWSHGEGWCPAVGCVYSVTTAASAFHWLHVAAAHAVSWCIVESLPRRNHESLVLAATGLTLSHAHTSVLWPFFRDHPGEPMPEENFWTLWCKQRLTETDTPTIQLVATPFALTSAQLYHPPFLQAGCPSCRPTNTVRALKAHAVNYK